jgi:hypothetical protein
VEKSSNATEYLLCSVPGTKVRCPSPKQVLNLDANYVQTTESLMNECASKAHSDSQKWKPLEVYTRTESQQTRQRLATSRDLLGLMYPHLYYPAHLLPPRQLHGRSSASLRLRIRCRLPFPVMKAEKHEKLEDHK